VLTPPSRRLASYAVPVVLATVVLACTSMAFARFTRSAEGGPETVSSAILSPASKVVAAQVNCRANKAVEVSVAWTASSSSYVASYAVERATGNGSYTVVSSVLGGKTSYTDTESLGYSTTYDYRVSAVYQAWSTSSTTTVVKTLTKGCLSS
jgi:hypothetical protein